MHTLAAVSRLMKSFGVDHSQYFPESGQQIAHSLADVERDTKIQYERGGRRVKRSIRRDDDEG